MIRLKIGDNYLVCNEKEMYISYPISFMMSCFKKHNATAIAVVYDGKRYANATTYIKEATDVLKIVQENGSPKEVYLLYTKIDVKRGGYHRPVSQIPFYLDIFKDSGIQIKVIDVSHMINKREFKIGLDVYNILSRDKNSLLYHLPQLGDYKKISLRQKNILPELKVVENNIKNLSKEKKTFDRKITLKDLEYLQLIDDVKALNNGSIQVDIKPLFLFPSEKLGQCISRSCFEENPYMYKAASYIYQGYNFGMVGTRININTKFTPEFIETHNHDFDDMFKINNWSTIGYLHFGQGHLCGGEFNDVIAHTAEHGLEYYFLCLKQYITTANIRDYAGYRIWWYPIYDKDWNLVYCAGLDHLRDILVQKANSESLKEELRNMSIQEFLDWKKLHDIDFRDYNFQYRSTNINFCNNTGKDNFLEVCKEKDIDLYNKIMERMN